MDKALRYIERLFYKVFLIGLAFIGIVILSGYWLFKTDSGQTFLTEKALENANSKLSYHLAYESVSSKNGKITIKDLHLDTPNKERLISLDSLRTGVLLSSIFKSTITIPELAVFGLRVEKTIDQPFLDSFKKPLSQDSAQVKPKGLLNRYLSQLSWTFSQLNLKLDSLAIDLDQQKVLLEQIYIDFDFLQLSTNDFYAVMDTLNVEATLNEEKHSLKAQGIIYRDLSDFAFSNMKILLDDHYFHFNLEAIDVFNDEQNGLKQARFIDFQLYNDSYVGVSSLVPDDTFFDNFERTKLGFNLKFLPKDGILEIAELTISQKQYALIGNANVYLPDFQFRNYDWKKVSGDLELDLGIEPSFLPFIPNEYTFNRSYITKALKLNLKSSLYANELNQKGSLIVQGDTVHLTHKLNLLAKNDYLTQDLKLSAKKLALGSILNGDKTLILANPKLNANFSHKGTLVDQISVTIDFDELEKYRLKRTALTLEGTLEKPLFFLNTKIAEGEISSYGELSLDKGLTFASIKSKLDNLSIQDLTGIDLFSSESLSGDIEILYNSATSSVFSLKGLIKKTVNVGSEGLDHKFMLDLSKDDSLGYLASLSMPFLDLTIKTSNTKELVSKAQKFDKTALLKFVSYVNTNDNTFRNSVLALPSFDMSAKASLKHSDILGSYFATPLPSFIDIELEGELSKNNKKLEGKFSVNSDSISFDKIRWKDFSSWLTFNIDASDSVSEGFRTADFTLNLDKLRASEIPIEGISIKASVRNNKLLFTQKTDNFIQNARFDYSIDGQLTPQGLYLNMNDFLFGNDVYAWRSIDTARIVWDDFAHADIENVALINGAERIEIDGSLGKTVNDLINYRLVNLDLEKLSTLLQSRLPFAGLVNGSFTLSSSTQTPFFEGKLSVDSLTLRGRTMGDLTIKSSLDSLSGLFLANLALKTDSLLNPGIPKQNIYGSGFFNPKSDGAKEDTLAYLGIEFEDLSMWFLPSVASSIFDSTSGRATGYGSFLATGEDFDYDAFFSVDSVYAKPRFINTDYFLSGPIYFTRSEGVIIDTVLVEDRYGNAKLWGNVDLNDFQEEKFMNLTMRLNGLQFMNNVYDPDVPFYGNVRGTGTVTLKGSSFSPTIATPDPIRISPGSEIKLPLLDETEFETDRNYIRFTEDFSRPGLSAQELINRNKVIEQKAVSIFSRQNNNVERKFIDFFNLELLFSAPEETTIELIFDDVTNEILRANGSGDIRVGLSDKELLINGTYTLSSGSYNFVSADFFNRKFSLQSGGTIRWDGDPTNAQINVSAVYTQRADFSSFLGQNASSNSNTTFRYPIDMVLDITGRLQSIENDYRFRLGQNMEFATNLDIINNVIASVNTEQYKLYQATSFLLTNSFLPVENGAAGGLAGANRSVISNIQQNPDALIAPLLSGQINNLLNTNLGTVFQNLEIDLNLSTLDQIDLGLALRLFQDRLTIRRNRSVATTQNVNTIGDIDANYQLNNSWSVLMFHRQDPLFSDVSGVNNNQTSNTQALNGVGLEWQQQFSSWQNLTFSIRKAWRRFFGLKDPAIKEDEEQSEQSITKKN